MRYIVETKNKYGYPIVDLITSDDHKSALLEFMHHWSIYDENSIKEERTFDTSSGRVVSYEVASDEGVENIFVIEIDIEEKFIPIHAIMRLILG